MTYPALRPSQPLAELPAVPAQEHDGDPLSLSDYRSVKASLPTQRDLIITMTLFASGLRGAEVLRVRRADVGDDMGFVALHIMRGKRRRFERRDGKVIIDGYSEDGRAVYRKAPPEWEWVYLPPTLGIHVRGWMNTIGLRGSDPLFPGRTYQGSPRTYSMRNYEEVFKAAALRSLGHAAHPHLLRGLSVRTVEQIADRAGVKMDTRVGKAWAGHEMLSVTEKYYQGLPTADKMAIARLLDEYV